MPPIKLVPNPIAINIIENPSKKNAVCIILLLRSIAFSSFNSETDIPVMYDKMPDKAVSNMGK